jgi:hypothetical protein
MTRNDSHSSRTVEHGFLGPFVRSRHSLWSMRLRPRFCSRRVVADARSTSLRRLSFGALVLGVGKWENTSASNSRRRTAARRACAVFERLAWAKRRMRRILPLWLMLQSVRSPAMEAYMSDPEAVQRLQKQLDSDKAKLVKLQIAKLRCCKRLQRTDFSRHPNGAIS